MHLPIMEEYIIRKCHSQSQTSAIFVPFQCQSSAKLVSRMLSIRSGIRNPQRMIPNRFMASFTLSRLHRTYDALARERRCATRSIRAGVSGRYPVIPPVGLPVLQERVSPPFALASNLFSWKRYVPPLGSVTRKEQLHCIILGLA